MSKFYTNEKNIITWLDKYKVKNYTLIPDENYGFVVNVSGDVNLNNEQLTFIPVKFNKVDGYFSCCNNKLNNLEFCPSYVGVDFYCYSSKLTSLEFCPSYVGRNFSCYNNKLTSLEFCPKSVGNSFYCGGNKLKNLEFCPIFVGRNFFCDINPKLGEVQKITDFKYIYLKHREFLIEKFSHSLTSNLNIIASNKKSVKI